MFDIDIAIIGVNCHRSACWSAAWQVNCRANTGPCNAANINNHVKIIYVVRYDCLPAAFKPPIENVR